MSPSSFTNKLNSMMIQRRCLWLSRSLSSHASVNAEETRHFNALAQNWWDPKGSSRLLHLMNASRIQYLQDHVGNRTDLRCLDIGCGGGILAESLSRMPFVKEIRGIDAADEVIRIARNHARQTPETSKIKYECISAENLLDQRGERQWDLITAFEILEHVDYPAQFLATVGRLLKPGGTLIISTIARTITAYVLTILAAEKLLRIVPNGTHDWRKYIKADELNEWFEKNGDWETIDIRPVRYIPFLGWRMGVSTEPRHIEGNYYFTARKTAISLTA